MQHREAPDNNLDTEFDFTDENYERVGSLTSYLQGPYTWHLSV